MNTPYSAEWWAEHTVVRRAVTCMNAHGVRVLFSLPERGLYLLAETGAHAERQLAMVRARWPEGSYEIREVRFWRDENDGPGEPVHVLVEADTSAPASLREVLCKVLDLVERESVVIMRRGSDYQVRLVRGEECLTVSPFKLKEN